MTPQTSGQNDGCRDTGGLGYGGSSAQLGGQGKEETTRGKAFRDLTEKERTQRRETQERENQEWVCICKLYRMDPGRECDENGPRKMIGQEEQEEANLRAVTMATANSLADVKLMFMAPLGEGIWGLSQGDQGAGITAQSDQCRCPQVK